MSVIEKIKETCVCGASLEYETEVQSAWESDTISLQTAFLKAHEVCRTKPHQRVSK